MSTSAPINFEDYISGSDALVTAAKAVRSLGKDVAALGKTVGEDAGRVKAGLADIAAALQGVQGKAIKLNLVSQEDKKLLSEYITQVADLKTAREALKKTEEAQAATQKVLADASKAAVGGLKELQGAFKDAVSAGDVEAQKKAAQGLADLKRESEQTGKALRGMNSEFTAVKGSYNALTIENGKLLAELRSLDGGFGGTNKRAEELKKQIFDNTTKLKDFDKEVNQNFRNVGNYGDALKGSAGGLGQFGDALKSAGGQGLNLFSGQLGQAQGLADKFKGGLDVLKTGLGGVKTGSETAVEGTTALKFGLASTGIGLLIIAFTTLIAYFTESAEGAKILKGVTAGLGAVFQVVKDVVVGVGKGIVSAFTDPKQALIDLGQLIEDQVTNRFKAFGVIFQAIGKGDLKGLANGVLQLNTGVTNSIEKMQAFGKKISDTAAEGYKLVGFEKELIKSRRELEIEDVKEQSRVAVLLRLSKDRSKSAGEQLKSLKEAGEIEARLTAAQIAQQEKELDLIQRKIVLKGTAAKADLLAEEGEKKKQIAQTLAAQDETNARIQVRESVFREKQATDAKAASKAAQAAAAAAAQERARARQVAIEIKLTQVTKGSERELALQKQLIDAQIAVEVAGAKKTAQERKLLALKGDEEKRKLQAEFEKRGEEAAKKANEAEKQRAEARIKEADREYAESVKLLNDYLSKEKAAIDVAYIEELRAAGTNAKQIANAKETQQAALLKVEEKGLNGLLAVNKDYAKNVGDIEEKMAQNAIKKQEKVTKDLQEQLKKREALISKTAGYINQAADYYAQVQGQRLDNQAATEEKNYTRNVKAAGNNKQLLAVIEEEHQKKLAEFSRRKAKQDQAAAAFRVELSTAEAIAKAFAEYGPTPAVIGPIAIAAANGAAQLALIYGQTIPEFFRGRKGGAAVPLASVAEHGAELIERASGPVRFEYAAKPGLTSLGAGDSVYTAAETARMLATAGLSQSQAMQPGAVAAAFSGAARDAHMARTAGPDNYGKLSAAVEANTAALSKIKPVVVNVGPGSDASVQTSAGITQYLNQRTFGK